MGLSICYYEVIMRTMLPLLSPCISLGTGKEKEETNLLQQLSDACFVVDALEPSVREELVNNFCSRELTSYEQIFEGAGMLVKLSLPYFSILGVDWGKGFVIIIFL